MVPNHVLYQVEPHLDGALEGIRTPDLLVRSQTLYPTELRAQHNTPELTLDLLLIWWLRQESNPRSSA